MTIQFTSLRGTTLHGKVQEIRKMKGVNVSFVKMLHKLYAITDGYTIDEAEESADMTEFTQQVALQL